MELRVLAELVRHTAQQDAGIKNPIVVGEAAGQVSDAFRKAQPDLPWRRMIGMRDILVYPASM